MTKFFIRPNLKCAIIKSKFTNSLQHRFHRLATTQWRAFLTLTRKAFLRKISILQTQ